MGASSSKQQEQEEQETSTTVGTLSAPLQSMAPEIPEAAAADPPTAQAQTRDRRDLPRLVLLGTTGAGKSSTGNILLGSKAFKVVIGGLCGPTEVIVKANGDWVVVDTPGMGDIPERMPGMSDGEFKQFCKERRQELFINVTKELRQHGGLVLYVLEAGRLLDMKRDHLIAIKEVLSGCFTSSVVLLLTKVPRARQIQQVVEEKQLLGGSSTSNPAERTTRYFYAWLKDQRRIVEERCQLRFAEVLGVGLEDDFLETHPAHPRYLQEEVLSLIHGGGNRPPLVGLAPGVALDWDALVNDRLKQADFINTTNAAINNTKTTITNQEEIRDGLMKRQNAMRVVGAAAGAAGAALGTVSAFFGPFAPIVAGVGGGVAAVGGLASAITAWVTEQQLNSIVTNLEKLRDELREQREKLSGYQGMDPQALLQRVEEIKRLVQGS